MILFFFHLLSEVARKEVMILQRLKFEFSWKLKVKSMHFTSACVCKSSIIFAWLKTTAMQSVAPLASSSILIVSFFMFLYKIYFVLWWTCTKSQGMTLSLGQSLLLKPRQVLCKLQPVLRQLFNNFTFLIEKLK